MARRRSTAKVEALELPKRIAADVTGWRNQGYYPFPSETTRQLLDYWFEGEHEEGERFYDCQRQAIETVIYCHEVRGIRSMRQLYEEFAPERLNLFKSIADEVDSIPFMKYCFKMATGSGKTWVLAALVIWQYFNSINKEKKAPFSARFMVVTPGLEVLNRILDSFKGKRDPDSGNRDPASSDYKRPLFMPEDTQWRGRFSLLDNVLEPGDIRANTAPPDGPFAVITNWQQFVTAKEKASLAEQIGLSIPEEPRGEIVADFVTEYPDIMIMNDEAHHVHGKKTARAEELVWRRFMELLDNRMAERHGQNRGLFMQMDFSATPFYGSGRMREYFPHIVYDFDLRDALSQMLVKQLFLEERQVPAGQWQLSELDFRAEREVAEKGRRGAVMQLSEGQKQIIDIGRQKLNQLTEDFENKGLNRKPVMMVLCEDTTVANQVYDHLLTCEDYRGELFGRDNVILFHSELKKDKHGYTMEEARPKLERIDRDDDPLRIVVSVLALREGFDKTNICVIAVLRATEADILLEQIVGRGLRLMFPAYKYDQTIQDAKRQAFEALQKREAPQNSLDFLYVVEHPRFRSFYDGLRREGYMITGGDSSRTEPTGDLVPVEAAPGRIAERDIAWPVVVQEEAKLPDLREIDARDLPSGTWDLDQMKHTMATLAITDRHLETDTKAKTWQLRDRYFDYAQYLRVTARKIATQGKTQVLTGRMAEIAELVDEYTTHRLFGRFVDFNIADNYKVLAYEPIQDHVVELFRNILAERLGRINYEVRRGIWSRLSDLNRIFVRENAGIETYKCIYPKMGYSARYGGFERRVMLNLLEGSGEVKAWCKLQRKHGLAIAYRDPAGLLRTYEVDFLVRTEEGCYLLETKSDEYLTHPTVGVKTRAAKQWCESINGVKPEDREQPDRWEYLLLNESTLEANPGGSFNALMERMRQTREKVIAEQFHGLLF